MASAAQIHALIAALAFLAFVPVQGAELSFNRDIRPILAGNCYDCHGPDEESRKAKLRLDRLETAQDLLEPGGELVSRITTDDPDDRMPPPDSHNSLDPGEIELLTRWIEDGARYEAHWAFVPPRRPDPPKVNQEDWPRNPIDDFVLHRLEQENLSPAAEADRYTLVRRLYLDLIGLPPTPEEADAFVCEYDAAAARDAESGNRGNGPAAAGARARKEGADSPARPFAVSSPEVRETQRVIEALVDRLLDSPRYGERWARQWLDLARYADTNGYEKDRPRSVWPYRDWVVHALNGDMPFDQFTIEQLAGDMLPDATIAQRTATGFHRNTMINEEGGIDPLEYRFYSMVDRVATTGTVWLGLTTGCAQCHTHKYDPITHTDYYRLMALLNNADEPDLDVPNEVVAQRRAELNAEIASLEVRAMADIDAAAFIDWLEREREKAVSWTAVAPVEAIAGLPRLRIRPDGTVFASGDFNKREVYTLRFRLDGLDGNGITAIRLDALPDPRLPAHGPGIGFYEGRRGDFFLSEVTARSGDKRIEFSGASHSFGKISVGSGDAEAKNVLDGNGSTGWSTATREGEAHHLVLNLSQPLETPVDLEIELLFERHFAAALGRFGFAVTTSPRETVAFPSGAPDPLTASIGAMKRHYVRTAEAFAEAQKEIAALEGTIPEKPTTPVMRERPPDNPRVTHRHHRGEYLHAEEEVGPAVPEMFPQLPEDQPANRLTFARWLVSDRNPLAARVAVNRAWQAIFGRGLVKTADDFGTQAAAPSHPELLDWLACEFVANGWSLKKLHRLLVTSATYRQDSSVASDLLARDPENELLARGPRFRLDGEAVRDAALTAAGLLSDKMGGPSVYPPQPASVTELAYGNPVWDSSKDEDRYRRSLYTFSMRTAPFAAYTVFDAPTGESCIARRDRSNTPLQALTLLNDAMFLEMAESLAALSIESAGTDRERAAFIFRRCLTRKPAEAEIEQLLAFYRAQRERFAGGELNARALLVCAEPDPELAAWALVARAVLNLDETITK